MKGLLIKTPWIDLIFQRKKTWEIRGSNINLRGEIALIRSGSSTIIGTVELVDSKKLTQQEYQESENYHCVPKKDCFQSRYKNLYAWVIRNPILFNDPIPYKHPMGAVIWVNLP